MERAGLWCVWRKSYDAFSIVFLTLSEVLEECVNVFTCLLNKFCASRATLFNNWIVPHLRLP